MNQLTRLERLEEEERQETPEADIASLIYAALGRTTAAPKQAKPITPQAALDALITDARKRAGLK